MTAASLFGSGLTPYLITLLSTLLALLLRLKAEVYFIPAAGLSSLIHTPLKALVARPRPNGEGFGFPSGHVIYYTVYFGFLFYLAHTSAKKSRKRTAFLLITVILIVLIGPSRIYLGDHWPADVAGGYLIGGLLLALIIRVYEHFRTSSSHSRLRLA